MNYTKSPVNNDSACNFFLEDSVLAMELLVNQPILIKFSQLKNPLSILHHNPVKKFLSHKRIRKMTSEWNCLNPLLKFLTIYVELLIFYDSMLAG